MYSNFVGNIIQKLRPIKSYFQLIPSFFSLLFSFLTFIIPQKTKRYERQIAFPTKLRNKISTPV